MARGGSPISLLWRRRFAPLFGIQFGGALNDNVLRNAMVALITFGALSETVDNTALLVQATLGLFILPFFLLSATAGRLADNCPDRRVAFKFIKAAEIGTMLIAAVGLALGNYWLLLVAVCGAGVQSAYFGPFKYAFLPELLERKELIAGNGLLNASTYLAILLGIVWGTELGATATNPTAITAVLCAIAVAGFALTFLLPAMPGNTRGAWSDALPWHFFRDTAQVLRDLFKQRQLAMLIGYITWFWASGAVILAQLPIYVSDVTFFDHVTYLYLLLLVCSGIACGSLLVIAVLRKKVTTAFVPLGLVVSALPLFFLPSGEQVTVSSTEELRAFSEFFDTAFGLRASAVMFVTALGMGFYIVPLYATLQLVAKPDRRGSAIAANNICNAFLIVVGVVVAGALIGAHEKLADAMRWLFVILAVVALALAAAARMLLPKEVD